MYISVSSVNHQMKVVSIIINYNEMCIFNADIVGPREHICCNICLLAGEPRWKHKHTLMSAVITNNNYYNNVLSVAQHDAIYCMCLLMIGLQCFLHAM